MAKKRQRKRELVNSVRVSDELYAQIRHVVEASDGQYLSVSHWVRQQLRRGLPDEVREGAGAAEVPLSSKAPRPQQRRGLQMAA